MLPKLSLFKTTVFPPIESDLVFAKSKCGPFALELFLVIDNAEPGPELPSICIWAFLPPTFLELDVPTSNLPELSILALSLPAVSKQIVSVNNSKKVSVSPA